MTQTMSTLLYEVQRFVLEQNPKNLKVGKETVIQTVCDEYKVQLWEMQQHCRRKRYVKPRQIVCFLLRQYTDMSLYEIGKLFYRDHTTTIHSCAKVDDMMRLYPEYRAEIRKLQSRLNLTKNEE